MNLYKVKAKNDGEYQVIYVNSFSFSEVENYIKNYCLKDLKTIKKFSDIESIIKIGEEDNETLLNTFKV